MADYMVGVVVCTHNPRRDYLKRVLDALRAQSLPREQWHLLLIDNHSDAVLAAEVDLTWHPHARNVREETLGLTHARLRGIAESSAPLLVFVDDDNVLDRDYLEQAVKLSQELPQMGAWCGSIRGEYETPLPQWYAPYLNYLAVREIDRDYWTNCDYRYGPARPCGAGLCVRRQVAEDYREKCRGSGSRLLLDRRGASLVSGGDDDLALCALDCGLGIGRFARLRLTHLIPAKRLELTYLVSLRAGIRYSSIVLGSLRTETGESAPAFGWRRRVALWRRCLSLPPLERAMAMACERAEREAWREVAVGRARQGMS